MNSVTNRAFMAKKKMYIQPEMIVSPVAPQNIICASGEFDETNDQIGGQAPGRQNTEGVFM